MIRKIEMARDWFGRICAMYGLLSQIEGGVYIDRITPVLKELKGLSVESMLIYRHCILVFKCLRGLAIPYNYFNDTKFLKTTLIHKLIAYNKKQFLKVHP